MDELLYEVRDGVGYVTLNRPQARNALTFAMYDRLAEICDAASKDAERKVKAILITGAGASIAACSARRFASRPMKHGFPLAPPLGNCLSLARYNRLVYLVGPSL